MRLDYPKEWILYLATIVVVSCSPAPLEVPEDVGDSQNSHDAADTTSPSDISTTQDTGQSSDICSGTSCETTDDVSVSDPDADSGSTGDADIADDDPCDPDPCPSEASCSVSGDDAQCHCPTGYRFESGQCIAEGPTDCSEIDCSGHCADCQIIDGIAQCSCPNGYEFDGQDCNLADDPCQPNPCNDELEVCVPEAHCQPLGSCAERCDCSNCPNCDADNSDGKWDNLQQYCGNNQSSPATMECNDPCSSPGDGCLPYAEQFCWPAQGCFSL